MHEYAIQILKSEIKEFEYDKRMLTLQPKKIVIINNKIKELEQAIELLKKGNEI